MFKTKQNKTKQNKTINNLTVFVAFLSAFTCLEVHSFAVSLNRATVEVSYNPTRVMKVRYNGAASGQFFPSPRLLALGGDLAVPVAEVFKALDDETGVNLFSTSAMGANPYKYCSFGNRYIRTLNKLDLEYDYGIVNSRILVNQGKNVAMARSSHICTTRVRFHLKSDWSNWLWDDYGMVEISRNVTQ